MAIFIELDALVVGAGFGGVYQLWKLRNEGYNVKLVEAGADFGGVWHWNRYPGCRVDVEIPMYQFSNPELWKNYTWKKKISWVQRNWTSAKMRYSTQPLRPLALMKPKELKWTVKANAGASYKVKYLLLNTGFAAKRYVPDYKGLDKFKGEWLHPSYWPKQGLDLADKKVAIVGTGATGLQLTQALSKVAKEVVVFQRTPNLAIPMRQVSFTDEDQIRMKSDSPAIFNGRASSFGGLDYNFLPKATFDDSPEQRLETYERLWNDGSFHYWLATYHDMLFDQDANKEAYNFWRDKTRQRINDPRLKEKLAPMVQPYSFGCKRVALEIDYFDSFNQPNVDLVDVNDTPVEEITEKGIETSDKEWEFDCIILATGYDAVTGGLVNIDIRGPSGKSLAEKWKEGCYTYLGMAVAGFPNMFFSYGPQAPTALCNGPTCAEMQGDWIIDVMNHMRKNDLATVDASRESEVRWAKAVHDIAYMSLLPGTKSWYMGDNIPGKPREPLIWLGGVPAYHAECQKSPENGYAGFSFT